MAYAKKLMKMYMDIEKSEDMHIIFQEENVNKCEIMFFGPPNSPYEGGVFYFSCEYVNYPIDPPKVSFLTGGIIGGRIHPNLYREGKVCVSILNTWGGKEWSPLLSTEKIFMTIRALLDENPITFEPGYEKLKKTDTKAFNYDVNARYLSLLSVEKCMSSPAVPEKFKNVIKEYVEKNKELYVKQKESLNTYDGNTYNTLHHSTAIQLSKITFV